MTQPIRIAAIAIGRNEGQRLVQCLSSLQDKFDHIVYVDSGSEDGSLEAAKQAGADVVSLDLSIPFTAARARNAGLEHLSQKGPMPDFIQFLDGDCVLQPFWLDQAAEFLMAHPDVAAVCGRRRERFPKASLYNQLIDMEWATPIGEAKACGGDVLMRVTAITAVGHYNPALIAGEEPELCVRLRQAGWRIWRLDAEMTLHDAQITKIRQWWRRTQRGGFAFAQGADMHGAPPERHFVTETRRAVLWGLVLPMTCLLAIAVVSPWAILLLLIWPVQMLRLRLRGERWLSAVFLTLSKFPEAQGAAQYFWRRLRGGRIALIEYK